MHEQRHIKPVHWSRTQLPESEEGVAVSARACWGREGSVQGTELSAASQSQADAQCGSRLRLRGPRTLTACPRAEGLLPARTGLEAIL